MNAAFDDIRAQLTGLALAALIVTFPPPAVGYSVDVPLRARASGARAASYGASRHERAETSDGTKFVRLRPTEEPRTATSRSAGAPVGADSRRRVRLEPPTGSRRLWHRIVRRHVVRQLRQATGRAPPHPA